MKKLKIMLLSLALFAIVGAALAFKAKFSDDWCIGTPYGTGTNLYCTHNIGTPGGAFTTTTCTALDLAITDFDPAAPNNNVRTVCTSAQDPDDGCQTLCPDLKAVERDF